MKLILVNTKTELGEMFVKTVLIKTSWKKSKGERNVNLTNLAPKNIKITEEYLNNAITIILDNGDEVDMPTYIKTIMIKVLEETLSKEE
jgi:hypothetical protein